MHMQEARKRQAGGAYRARVVPKEEEEEEEKHGPWSHAWVAVGGLIDACISRSSEAINQTNPHVLPPLTLLNRGGRSIHQLSR